MLPVALRVKPFVIHTDDIKLDIGLMTATIDIEKFDLDQRRKRQANGQSNDFYAAEDEDDDEIAPSESDLSYVVRQRETNIKMLEVFSGVDPLCNCQNLDVRITSLTREQKCEHVTMILLVLLAQTLAVHYDL